MKICFKCKERKPRRAFYSHPQMADGLLGKCKDCTKTDATAHRKTHIEYYRAYDRARVRRSRPSYQKEYRSKYPQRRAAHVALNNAVRDGRVSAWPVCAIPDCDCAPEAHHTHYDAPLEVVWLCPAHHKQLHAFARAPF